MTTEKTTAKAPKEAKAWNFTFLLYPDSAPENFIDLLTEKQDFPIAVSPLHNQDPIENPDKVDRETLEKYNGMKKPHYHCIIRANGPLTAGAIRKRLQNSLGRPEAVGMVQICHNVKGAYEYLTHESIDAKRKKKHVYPKEDIKIINDYDITRYVTISADERKQNYRIVCDLICAYQLCNVIDLRLFIEANPDCGIEWDAASDVIEHRSSVLRLYFDGAYQTRQREEEERRRHNERE